MKLEEFNEYLKHLDPVKKEVANNWKVGIGLQAVDGLHVSEFLLDIAYIVIQAKYVAYILLLTNSVIYILTTIK